MKSWSLSVLVTDNTIIIDLVFRSIPPQINIVIFAGVRMWLWFLLLFR